MKLSLLERALCSACLALVVAGQGYYPVRVDGLAQLRALLGVRDNVVLAPVVNSSGVSLAHVTENTRQNQSVQIKFQPRANDHYVYDSGVTAEFATNGSFTGVWDGRGADVIVNDAGVARISPQRAFSILATAVGLCRYQQFFRLKVYELAYLRDPQTKLGRLVYRISFVYDGRPGVPPSQPVALIDATTGAIIEKWNGFTTQLATTTIKAFGGNQGPVLGQVIYPDLNVGLQTGGNCIYSTPDVQVQNMRFATSGAFAPTTFVCSQANSETYDNVNGGYSALNDAARHAQTTVSMYREYTGFNGPQNSVPVQLRVHYGANYSNAFWDGTYANFGDGTPRLFYPLTTLDNVAHELGHSYTGSSFCSRLEYSGESGGINEAFSDMSGQAAFFFSKQTPTLKPGLHFTVSGAPVRDMCNPTSDGLSIDNYANYRTGMDVHYSSGLYNKAFCLLQSLGGDWTLDNTFQIFAFANRMYWQQLTNFNSGVCGVQNAANYFLGAPGVAAVKNAFSNVGLRCP